MCTSKFKTCPAFAKAMAFEGKYFDLGFEITRHAPTYLHDEFGHSSPHIDEMISFAKDDDRDNVLEWFQRYFPNVVNLVSEDDDLDDFIDGVVEAVVDAEILV